jgi:hypothetical protein
MIGYNIFNNLEFRITTPAILFSVIIFAIAVLLVEYEKLSPSSVLFVSIFPSIVLL